MLLKGECAMSLVLEFASCVVKNLVNVPEDVMRGWVQNPRALQKALTLALCPPKKEPKLLRRVGVANVMAVSKFVIDDDTLKAMNIGYTGSNFDRQFRGKVEENVPAGIIGLNHLGSDSSSSPIMAELGDKAVSFVSYLFDLIRQTNEAMARSEPGPLLTNGYNNVLFAIGNNGNTWAVFVLWDHGGSYWCLEARPVRDSWCWFASDQILSCDS